MLMLWFHIQWCKILSTSEVLFPVATLDGQFIMKDRRICNIESGEGTDGQYGNKKLSMTYKHILTRILLVL